MQLTETYQLELQRLPKHAVMDHFVRACEQGSLPVIRHVLTSPKMAYKADIHAFDDYALVAACIHGHLPVLKYLLESPELTEHANILSKNYHVFHTACRRRHGAIIKYLLSLRGENHIDFRITPYSLEWAMEQKYHAAIKGMMLSLKEYDYIDFLENLPNVQHFCVTHNCLGLYDSIIKDNSPSYDGHEIAISL